VKVLVVTVVHRPDDARIRQRQIEALLAAGVEVTYAAPFTDWGVAPDVERDGLRCLDLPRAVGRRRLAAARAARALLRAEAPRHDVVLVHDPELVPALATLRGAASMPVRVWDVHEDTAAALSMKSWLPSPLRRPVAGGVHTLEGFAEKRIRLLLAEDGYRDRFHGEHPVVPNSTPVPADVPPPDRPVAVYVGHVTAARGGAELVALAARLRAGGSGVRVEVVGHADAETAAALTAAAGDLTWHGFVPNQRALEIVQGSMVGLSLLHDEPNYRHSRPTKVLEYMARGVPVVTTPTPPARALVEEHACGIVVPFGDIGATYDAVRRLEGDAGLRAQLAKAGHAAALAEHDWARHGREFVDVLQAWAAAR
jgi:glycosyltransferase involved in cell wall biosynthesis